jgi:hypothetical protein
LLPDICLRRFICHRLEDKTIHLVLLTLARFGKIHAVRQQLQTAAMLISPRLWQKRALRWQTQRLFRRRDKIWIAREMTGASPTFAQNFV